MSADLRRRFAYRAGHHCPVPHRSVDREGAVTDPVAGGATGIGARVCGAMGGLPARVAVRRSPLRADRDRLVRS